jgi:hypothetical protein
MSLLELFCAVDNSWQGCRGNGRGTQVASGKRQQKRMVGIVTE